MAFQKDLMVDQGTLFTWDFIIRTNQAVAFDLTGYVARGQVRKSYDTGTVLFEPVFTMSPAIGKITMTITPDLTEVISFTGEALNCVYDIEIFNTSGDVKRIVEGVMTITREVTR